MIDTIVGWLKKTEYNDKYAITIANLVESMWLTRYTWSTGIKYDQIS